MIWKASMTPRLIAVGPNSSGSLRSHHSRQIYPALLSVNRESRHCALRHYNLRFTMILTVDHTTPRRIDEEFEGHKFHANVVMSTNDTLGLFGWELLHFGRAWRFKVNSADGITPWESYPTSHGVHPEVKKVAFLGRDIAVSQSIVRDLNSVASWDLDSILHAKSTTIRRLKPYSGHWYTIPNTSCTKSEDQILIHSRNFNGSLEDWGHRLIFRAKNSTLPLWSGAPDILAFQLGKEPERISGPLNHMYMMCIRDFYNLSLPSFVLQNLDEFYASRERRWVYSQGF